MESHTDFRGVIDYAKLRSIIPPGQVSLATVFGSLDSLSMSQP
jgi:hypothetical protein